MDPGFSECMCNSSRYCIGSKEHFPEPMTQNLGLKMPGTMKRDMLSCCCLERYRKLMAIQFVPSRMLTQT